MDLEKPSITPRILRGQNYTADIETAGTLSLLSEKLTAITLAIPTACSQNTT
jgi:RNA 3'-terminal phosphate cyclase